MRNYKKSFSKVIFTVITSALIFTFFSSVGFAQRSKRLVVVGRVIGVEHPEFGWAMHFENVKIFYVRIEKVLKGKSAAKYIRVAYGYNPSIAPQYILPQEMFDGKTTWKFDLSEFSDFDKKVSVSKSEGDWVDTKNSKKVKGSDFLPEDDPNRNEEFTTLPIVPKCVPIAGYEKEAAILETFVAVKGYWLDFERKRFKRIKE